MAYPPRSTSTPTGAGALPRVVASRHDAVRRTVILVLVAGEPVAWTVCPSGLRGWTQVPLARAAWVQIPQLSGPDIFVRAAKRPSPCDFCALTVAHAINTAWRRGIHYIRSRFQQQYLVLGKKPPSVSIPKLLQNSTWQQRFSTHEISRCQAIGVPDAIMTSSRVLD